MGFWSGLQNKIKGNKTLPQEQKPIDVVSKLHELYRESEIKDKRVHFPDWNITVEPGINELKDNLANLYFKITSPAWDQDLYECSVALGDTQDKAVGMALGSFAFGMMSGIKDMMKDMGNVCGGCTCEIGRRSLESQFANQAHQWRVYESDVVNIGNNHKDTKSYWDLISDGIAKRLGNQKLFYVKVYGCKFKEQITGECRINDVVSLELSQIIADYVSTWDVDGLVSRKQFFFLLQEGENYVPYPYTEQEIAGFTRKAIRMFDSIHGGEEYEDFVPRLTEEIGDSNLAQELYMFLPEMCTENAFPKISSNEQVGIYIAGEQEVVYQSQIASYYPILKALHAEFANQNISNELYHKYILHSSMAHAISSALEQGKNMIEDGGIVFVSFGASNDYQMR